MSDNLESYFRKHLKDETPGPEQWNVPSDNVWEKVQPGISKRKGIFIPWRYFYIFGMGLVLIISTLVLLPENAEDLAVNKSVAETETGKTDQIKTTGNVLDALQEKESENNIDGNLGVELSTKQVASDETITESNPNSKTIKSKTSSETGLLAEQTGIAASESDHTDQLIEDEKPGSPNNASIVTLIAVSGGVEGNSLDNSVSTINTGDNISNNPNEEEIISKADKEVLESDVFVYSSTIDQFD